MRKKMELNINFGKTSRLVKGYQVSDNFFIHKEHPRDPWRVTHIPSGFRVSILERPLIADQSRACEAAEKLLNWSDIKDQSDMDAAIRRSDFANGREFASHLYNL